MDLDKIFTKTSTQPDWSSFECSNKGFSIRLWLGSERDCEYSKPLINYASLSLNDFTHFTITINHATMALNRVAMHEIFGFDLEEFFGKSYPDCSRGYLVPKNILIKALNKIGIFDTFPPDAGDGE